MLKNIEKSGKIKCAFCRGTGIQPRSLSSKCLACRGKGEVNLEGPAIQCPSCKGTGRASNSSMLSCLHCKGVGVVEKAKSEGDSGNIIGKRLGEITKRLRWVRKETEKKTKEIEKRLKPIKPFIKEVSARGGFALGGKKETLWLEKLGNKIKEGWESFWKQ